VSVAEEVALAEWHSSIHDADLSPSQHGRRQSNVPEPTYSHLSAQQLYNQQPHFSVSADQHPLTHHPSADQHPLTHHLSAAEQQLSQAHASASQLHPLHSQVPAIYQQNPSNLPPHSQLQHVNQSQLGSALMNQSQMGKPQTSNFGQWQPGHSQHVQSQLQPPVVSSSAGQQVHQNISQVLTSDFSVPKYSLSQSHTPYARSEVRLSEDQLVNQQLSAAGNHQSVNSLQPVENFSEHNISSTLPSEESSHQQYHQAQEFFDSEANMRQQSSKGLVAVESTAPAARYDESETSEVEDAERHKNKSGILSRLSVTNQVFSSLLALSSYNYFVFIRYFL